MILFLIFLQVKSSIVDYRFGINFGMWFWDYSGNNNHGENKLSPSSIYLTDRGVFLLSIDSRISAPDNLELPSSVTYLAWVMPTDSEFRLLFRGINQNNRYHLGRKVSGSAVYIHVIHNGNEINKDGPNGSFPSSKWSLVALTYDGATFQAYVNSHLQVSAVSDFTTSSINFVTGIGTYSSIAFSVVHAFVWNYIIMSEKFSFSSYINTAGSSNCLTGGGIALLAVLQLLIVILALDAYQLILTILKVLVQKVVKVLIMDVRIQLSIFVTRQQKHADMKGQVTTAIFKVLALLIKSQILLALAKQNIQALIINVAIQVVPHVIWLALA